MFTSLKVTSTNPLIENHYICHQGIKIAVLRLFLTSKENLPIAKFCVIDIDSSFVIHPRIMSRHIDLKEIVEIISQEPHNRFSELDKFKKVLSCFKVKVTSDLGFTYLVAICDELHPSNYLKFRKFCTIDEAQEYIDNKENIVIINKCLHSYGESVSSLKIESVDYD